MKGMGEGPEECCDKQPEGTRFKRRHGVPKASAFSQKGVSNGVCYFGTYWMGGCTSEASPKTKRQNNAG